MFRSLKKPFVILLTLLVSLLPFSFSYGLDFPSTDAHPMAHEHAINADCAQPADTDHCLEMTQSPVADEDCCSDHCDSSFGAQPGIAVEYSLWFPPGRQYQDHRRAWTSGPIPSMLLRPPSAFS